MGDVVLPGDRDKEGKIVIGATPLASIQPIIMQQLHVPRSLDVARNLFRTVIYLAKSESPLSHFPGLMELQQINGVEVGNTGLHQNLNGCNEILRIIASSLRQQQTRRLINAKVISVIIDGSQEGRNDSEDEVVCVRF